MLVQLTTLKGGGWLQKWTRIRGRKGALTPEVDRAATLRLLQSDADADDIQARDQDARRKGVNSVPTFLIAQQYVVSGAQPSETWAGVITELAGRTE